MVRMTDKDLKNLTRTELDDVVRRAGAKTFHAQYLMSFIHRRFVHDIMAVTPLPQAFRRYLMDAGYHISRLALDQTLTDPDGTVKYFLTTPEGLRLESVLLKDGDRHTLCISSQSGCRMQCRFCATGQLGFQGHLSSAQIVDQVYAVLSQGVPVHNVVYMGMGEPLDNPDATLKSIQLLTDAAGQNLGQRRITVSTCGLPEGLHRLAQEQPQVRLAVSLHAADDCTRERLMPIARRTPLAKLLPAVRAYQTVTRRRVTIEYCLIQGVNDHPDHAQMLTRRLQGIKANINLIEFNEFPGCDLRSSRPDVMRTFARQLQQAGFETVIRYKRGRDINAACGQLGASYLHPSKSRQKET